MVMKRILKCAENCLLDEKDAILVTKLDTEIWFERVNDGTQYLSIGGSDSLIDWFYNIRSLTSERIGLHRYAKGFNEKYEELMRVLLDSDFVSELDRDRPLYVTGYSQGAAIAKLVAIHMRLLDYPKVKSVTFATPNIADRNWEKDFNNIFPNAIAIRNILDPICYLPFGFATPKNVEYGCFSLRNPHAMTSYLRYVLGKFN